MRNTRSSSPCGLRVSLLLPLLLTGCWPYIAVPPTADELNGGDTDTQTVPDTTDTTDETYDGWDSLCAPGPEKLGLWSKHPIAKAGAGIRNDNYTFDAGIGPVVTKALGATTPKAVSMDISGAVVTSVGPSSGSRVTLWVADKRGAIVLLQVPSETTKIVPGDKVQVHVTEVSNSSGVAEVTNGTVSLNAAGGYDVFVKRLMNGKNLIYDDYPEHMIEVWGELPSKPVDCGEGFDCFDFDHGANKTVTFRAPAGSARRYDCVHVIAPLDLFDGDTELTMWDETWFQTF